jgi:hypothetical protein
VTLTAQSLSDRFKSSIRALWSQKGEKLSDYLPVSVLRSLGNFVFGGEPALQPLLNRDSLNRRFAQSGERLVENYANPILGKFTVCRLVLGLLPCLTDDLGLGLAIFAGRTKSAATVSQLILAIPDTSWK